MKAEELTADCSDNTDHPGRLVAR